MLTPEQIIRHFALRPLPVEGGFFTQTYRAADTLPQHVLPPRYSSARSLGSAIFYLLKPDPDVFSALHRLPTDEIYHFYLGDPVEMLLLHPNGTSQRAILGQDILNGQHVQFAVPHGVWQGSYLMTGGRFALMGTTMAPGYDDSDFTGGDRAALVVQYPDQAELIRRLTRFAPAES
jgi:predicted cupin superfamily sugar epimerase